MNPRNDIDGDTEPVIFSALVTPHRSLSRNGFLILMGFLTAISFIAGVVFTMMGAWPVFGFFGLDVLIVWWAFRVNYRRAAATEEIVITHSEIRVRRVSHRGHMMEWTLNPLWVRLDVTSHEEFGIERIYLVSRGRRLSVGGFLGADEKESFAKALIAALNAAKRGPTLNPI